MRREELIKRFRKVAWGRLYWKNANYRWRHAFDSDDICIVRDGSATVHYKTLEAFIEDLELFEELDKDVRENVTDERDDFDGYLQRKYYGTPRGEQ